MRGRLENQTRGGKANWTLPVAVLMPLIATMAALLLRPRAPMPLPESTSIAPVAVSRTNLVLVAGRLCVSGQDGSFSGLMLEHSADGSLRSRSCVSNGLLHGISEGWYTNGQLQVTEHFREGVSHGRRTKWYADGTRLSEAVIADGRLHGPFRRWHANGALAEEIEMNDGEPDGRAKAYFPNGSLKSKTTLKSGIVIEQKLWKDGEYKEPTAETTTTALYAESP
jgi:antitoxin component YwqK of YwqJK toxin-antitoxin module